MPRFGVPDALRILRETGKDIPFIVVSGSIGEETAVECMKAGAWDYILKNRIKRLGPAVIGGLEQRRLRREQKTAEDKTRRSDEALRESEERYRQLVDSSPYAISVHQGGKIVFVNRAALSLMRAQSPEELLGKSIQEVVHPDGWETTLARIRRLSRGETGLYPVEDKYVRLDGSVVHVEVRAALITYKGCPAIQVIGLDITDRRKLEERLRQAQKMESIGILAGGVAHDFNNILTAIIGHGHVVLMKMSREDPLRQNIENILEAANRAAQLTKDLLLFSRKRVAERKPVDLNEVVGKAGKFLKRIIGEDVECKTELHGNPIPVSTDSQQLEQVLLNLATNARDAMPDGGSFTVRTEQVDLSEAFMAAHSHGKPGPYGMITVSDTGAGMDDGARKRIFDPFYTTKEVGKGTGLGLAVAYGIIRQHDGFIEVHSEPGKGTTFKIYLPVIASEAVEEETSREAEPPARGTETILLAEDNEQLRKLFGTVLTQFGYTVIEAVDGADAVRKFTENKDTVQLLLFDLIMPRMNGKEAHDEIAKLKPGVKTIFASGYSPDIARQKAAFGIGVSLINKPVSPADLLKKVRSVLDGGE